MLVYDILQVNVKFNPEQVMKAYRGSTVIALLLSLTSALDGVGGQRHAPVALPPVKEPGTHTHTGGQDE